VSAGTRELQQAGKSAILAQSAMQGQLPEEWPERRLNPSAVERRKEYSNQQLKGHLK